MALSRDLPLFAGVEPPEVRRLLLRCRQSRLDANALVFSLDEPPDFVWIVNEGLVHVTTTTRQGKQLTLDLAAPGELFGRLSGNGHERYPLTAHALTPALVLQVPLADYEELLRRSPSFSRNVLKIVATKLRDAQRMRGLLVEPSPRRVLQTLAWLHLKLGELIPVTRRVIADIAGVSGETSIRVLSPLEKQGIIQTHRGTIRVLDSQRLRAKLENNGR